MIKMKLIKHDPLELLKSDEDYKMALECAIEQDTGDGRLISATLENIEKAKAQNSGHMVIVKHKKHTFLDFYKSLHTLGFKIVKA